MNQKIRTSVLSVVSLKIPQMGESPKKYLEKILKSRNSVIGFYLLYGLIERVTKNWLLPLARPRAQEPGDYTSYLQSSSGLY